MSEMKNANDLANEIGLSRSFLGLDQNTGKSSNVPIGYNSIALSTEGKLFAPAIVHARSYNTGDMAHLSLVQTEHLPENNIKIIKSLIYEDVDPSTWHIKEVVEFMIKHHMTYFGSTLKEVPFQLTKEDRQKLSAKEPDKLKAIDEGNYIPRVDIDLTKLKFNLLDAPSRHISIGQNDFKVKFRLPQFGDIITVSTFMKSEFAASDLEFNDMLKTRDAEKQPLTSDEKQVYSEYLALKFETAANINLALLLEEVNGKPVAKSNGIKEAVELVMAEHRLDLSISQTLKTEADKIAAKFGIAEDVEMINPLTNKVEIRRFQFRLYDIFQAVLVSKSDRYTISIDP